MYYCDIIIKRVFARCVRMINTTKAHFTYIYIHEFIYFKSHIEYILKFINPNPNLLIGLCPKILIVSWYSFLKIIITKFCTNLIAIID